MPRPAPVRAHRCSPDELDAAFARCSGSTGPVVVLLPEGEVAAIPLVQAAATQARATIVGAVFPALVDGPSLSGEGCWLLPLDAGVEARLIPALSLDPVAAADHISAQIEPLLAPAATSVPAEQTPPALFLIFDALLPHIASVIDELYLRLADAVGLSGVNAGSEAFTPIDCLFSNTLHLQGGVLALLVPNAPPMSIAHGFRAPQSSLVATATRGNRILGIDWRPALTVYQELVAAAFGVELTAANFYTYACHYPLGILRASGELVARFPVALDQDGALVCIGEIPPGAVLVLLSGDDLDAARCVADVRTGACSSQTPSVATALVSWYCAGRRVHRGPQVGAELRQLADGMSCSAGALSLGEIGPLRPGGYPLFHNGAIMSIAWPWGPA